MTGRSSHTTHTESHTITARHGKAPAGQGISPGMANICRLRLLVTAVTFPLIDSILRYLPAQFSASPVGSEHRPLTDGSPARSIAMSGAYKLHTLNLDRTRRLRSCGCAHPYQPARLSPRRKPSRRRCKVRPRQYIILRGVGSSLVTQRSLETLTELCQKISQPLAGLHVFSQ